MKYSIDIPSRRERLKGLSAEQIRTELCKIIIAENFYMLLESSADVFSLLIPEIKDMIHFPQKNPYHDYDVFEHTVNAIRCCESEDLVVRLAVLFHDFGKPHSYQDGDDGIRHFKGHGRVSAEITDNIMQRLKFDNEIRKEVSELVFYHDASFACRKKHIGRWLNKIGEEQYKRLLQVRKADIMGQKRNFEMDRIKELEKIERLIEEVLAGRECFSLRNLEITGRDLIKTGYTSGAGLGITLQRLTEGVISGEYPNDREQLLLIAAQWLQEDTEKA